MQLHLILINIATNGYIETLVCHQVEVNLSLTFITMSKGWCHEEQAHYFGKEY